ncbi:MAG: hydroxyisourate hydrolase [Pseudomonadota bacterium]
MANGWLTTQVTDTARGQPADGIAVQLYRLEQGERVHLTTTRTNAEGRTDRPILAQDRFRIGLYVLIFKVGDYFRKTGQVADDPAFLDSVPIRFGVADADAHCHVPLMVSPHGYSIYRGG